MSMSIGERIKVLRVLNGLSQEDLASLSGINRASISCWEGDTYSPSPSKMQQLAKILGCSPAYMVFGEPCIESAMWILSDAERRQDLITNTVTVFIPKLLLENGFTHYLVDVDQKILILKRGESNNDPTIIVTESEYIWNLLTKVCLSVIKNAGKIVHSASANDTKEITHRLRIREYKKALAAFTAVEKQYLEAKMHLDSFADLDIQTHD